MHCWFPSPLNSLSFTFADLILFLYFEKTLTRLFCRTAPALPSSLDKVMLGLHVIEVLLVTVTTVLLFISLGEGNKPKAKHSTRTFSVRPTLSFMSCVPKSAAVSVLAGKRRTPEDNAVS